MLEQGGGGGIDFYTREVDAGDDHAIEHARQLFLVYIVLVQTDADGFGVDFSQWGRGVWQAARKREGAAVGGIQRGKFLAPRFGGRIDRCPRLVDDHVANLLARFLFEFANE